MAEIMRVLDIGAGGCGDYVKKDSPETLRVGLDQEHPISKAERQRYGVSRVTADASGEVYLPFKQNSFQHIDIILPFGTLLFGLCSSDFLWEEMHRVLRPEGSIKIINESPIFVDNDLGNRVQLDYIHEYMYDKAKENGFITTMERLKNPIEVLKEYGTETAEGLIDILKLSEFAQSKIKSKGIKNMRDIYEITAVKK